MVAARRQGSMGPLDLLRHLTTRDERSRCIRRLSVEAQVVALATDSRLGSIRHFAGTRGLRESAAAWNRRACHPLRANADRGRHRRVDRKAQGAACLVTRSGQRHLLRGATRPEQCASLRTLES